MLQLNPNQRVNCEQKDFEPVLTTAFKSPILGNTITGLPAAGKANSEDCSLPDWGLTGIIQKGDASSLTE
jgi:hypothetical protein